MKKRQENIKRGATKYPKKNSDVDLGFSFFDLSRPRFLSIAEFLIVIILALIIIQAFFFNEIQHVIVNIVVFSLVSLIGALLIYNAQYEVTLRIESQQLAEYLRDSNKKLLELDKLKSEFIYLATHQIRTPLTSIRGHLSNVLEEDYGEVPDYLHEPLHNALISSEEMVDKVEYFLHVTRIERGEVDYDMHPFDLRHLVENVTEQMKQVIDRTDLSYHVDIDDQHDYVIHGAPDKLRQALTNLIDNAIRYTKEGSVTVRLTKNDSLIRIEVQDTGIGLSEEDKERIFTKFGRAIDAEKANVFGTGLGLYIAKEIVHAHNGEIGMHSEGKGEGSTFFIELPEHA